MPEAHWPSDVEHLVGDFRLIEIGLFVVVMDTDGLVCGWVERLADDCYRGTLMISGGQTPTPRAHMQAAPAPYGDSRRRRAGAALSSLPLGSDEKLEYSLRIMAYAVMSESFLQTLRAY
jgi:hypothetical protein